VKKYESAMSKYSVYQIHLNESDSELLSKSGGWGEAASVSPKIKAYLDKDGSPQEAFNSGFYVRVADIEASDLEDVFKIGNIGPEESIKRYGRMHSVSVGDVIKDESGSYFAVSGEGFVEVFV